MKLRNKKTGEIIDIKGALRDSDDYPNHYLISNDWEDYEEPKEHWAIDQFGEPINVSGLSRLQLEKLHRLGNDFPSENATMKAIEKLKAWERLEDKGFRFKDWNCAIQEITFDVPESFYDRPDMLGEAISEETTKDLDLLFGGEE